MAMIVIAPSIRPSFVGLIVPVILHVIGLDLSGGHSLGVLGRSEPRLMLW